MPGTYTVSDIIRFFYPGLLILFLVGISDSDSSSILSASPAITIALAFLVGVSFFFVYRLLYGIVHSEHPAKKYVIEYIAEQFEAKLTAFPVYDYFLMRSYEEDREYSSNQSRLDSFVHLNFMTAIIFALYFILYFGSEYYVSYELGEVFAPKLFGEALALLFIGIILFLNGLRNDRQAEARQLMFVMDHVERIHDICTVAEKNYDFARKHNLISPASRNRREQSTD